MPWANKKAFRDRLKTALENDGSCDLENGHRVSEIKLRGKSDSVYVDCSCGAGECVGVWFSRPPPGWDPEGWDLVMTAIKTFLEYGQQTCWPER